jgi:hypothetical protein
MASMSILDDAIREHLELKRAHGADEAEVKRLEDEAFGPPSRPDEPDPFAEAPTEFMTQPEAPEATEPAEEAGGRRINIADLQEPPEPKAAEAPPAEVEVTKADEPQAQAEVTAVDEPLATGAVPMAPAEDPAQAAPPAEEEPPALEREAGAEEIDAGHSTEERHAIAEQPTQFFDIEAEMGTEDAPAPEAAEPKAAEPPIAPAEPPTEIHAVRTGSAEEADLDEEEDDDFWSEQRLSDELDQALEAPVADEPEAAAAPAPMVEPSAPTLEEEEEKEAEAEQRPDYDPDTGHEDVLEDTPDFLEDAPEDDELWFEQRPPKDFDLD